MHLPNFTFLESMVFFAPFRIDSPIVYSVGNFTKSVTINGESRRQRVFKVFD